MTPEVRLTATHLATLGDLVDFLELAHGRLGIPLDASVSSRIGDPDFTVTIGTRLVYLVDDEPPAAPP